eukprot:jgi/Psemu1/3546/gm1.3546_g
MIILANSDTTRNAAAVDTRITAADTSHHAPRILNLKSRNMSASHHLLKNLNLRPPSNKERKQQFDKSRYEECKPAPRRSYKLRYKERKPALQRHSYKPQYAKRKRAPRPPSTSTLSYEQRPTLAERGSQERPTPPQDNNSYYHYEQQNGAWGPSPMKVFSHSTRCTSGRVSFDSDDPDAQVTGVERYAWRDVSTEGPARMQHIHY